MNLEELKTLVSSNLAFAELLYSYLQDYNEDLPAVHGKASNQSERLRKLIGPDRKLDLSKDSEGMRGLLVHKDERIRKLAEAKLATSSWPLHQKRVRNLINFATARQGKVGIPVKYSGAHTHRNSGTDGVNFYNLPKRPKKGYELIKDIKNLVRAPKGYVLLTFDYSQIEARYLAYIAGQTDLVEAFREGRDVYSEAATHVFKKTTRKPGPTDPPPVVKQLTMRRNFGKMEILGCIAEGTLISTKAGWKAIEDITAQDRLWDGHGWVHHGGLVCRGEKQCINVSGVWLTPDHEVLNSRGWFQAIRLYMSNQISEKSTGNLELLRLPWDHGGGLSPSNVVAPVVEQLIHTETTLSLVNLPDVMYVLKKHLLHLIPDMDLSRINIVKGLLTEFVQSLAAVRPAHTHDMAGEEYEYILLGSEIEECFLDIWLRCRDGIIQRLKSTGLIITEGMSQTTYGSVLDEKTSEIRNYTTYDILNVGPNKRFQASNLIVSNSGYGMGATTFYNRCYEDDSLRAAITLQLADTIIKSYRKTYSAIPKFWKTVENLFKFVVKYPEEKMTKHGLVVEHESKYNRLILTLPSGSRLYYPQVTKSRSSGNLKWLYSRGSSLWGGVLVENIVQSASRDILVDAMLSVKRAGYNIAADLYDSFTALVKKEAVKDAEEELTIIACKPPEWCTTVPLAVEMEVSETL